ncbi:MAG: TlpA family protein disulfide reductase [Spirochaetota bacterium]
MLSTTYRKYRYFIRAAALTITTLIVISAIYYLVQLKREDYDTRKAQIRPAPEVSLADVAGEKHNLKQATEPGIVVIWTSWCGLCKDELRKLEKADLGDWSYTAINADEKSKEATDFIRKERIRKPLVLFDPESRLIPAEGYPTVYVSFGDGTWAGPLTHTDFDSLLKEIRHTLNRTEYKPYKASKAANERFWQSVYWQWFRYIVLASASLYFALLLIFIWKILPTSRLLIFALLLHFALATSENLGFLRLTDVVHLSGAVGNVISYLYYSPIIWGGLIALGILQYLQRELHERELAIESTVPILVTGADRTSNQTPTRLARAKPQKRASPVKAKKRSAR